jgi:S1-C subfamily serine protease
MSAVATAAPQPGDSVVLLLAEGEAQGSGVLLRHTNRGSWVVTNRHVLEGLSQVCVRSADGRLLPGLPVLPLAGVERQLDVAFVWLPRGAENLPLARLVPRPGPVIPFPIVTAGGYPVPDERAAAMPIYRELPGLLLPLLEQPLQGGMQLANTSPLRKGMSGGGLFDDSGRLIGISTTHPNPLWSGTLRNEAGRPLPPLLNRQLELVALAIPITRIEPLLDRLTVPLAGALSDKVCQGSLW